jgi:hypothetical protein
MLTHVFLLASLVAASLLTPAATSASAQPITAPEQLWAIECGGQYECVPDVLLTEVEARRCLGYPHTEEAQPGRRVEVRLTMERCDACQG